MTSVPWDDLRQARWWVRATREALTTEAERACVHQPALADHHWIVQGALDRRLDRVEFYLERMASDAAR
jgi:hypothetical protein